MTMPAIDSWPKRRAARRALLVTALLAMTGHASSWGGSPESSAQPGSPAVAPQLQTAKQTTLGLYVTAREAYEKWKAAPERVKILDVRTPEEFLFVGHAEMAWNVPVATQSYQWDAEEKQFPMRPLHDFVARARKVAEPNDTILVMCRSGGRSAIAVNLLAQAGFRDVYNITDGMEGDTVTDPASVFRGQRLVNGWKNSGLPWTYDVEPTRTALSPAL